MRQPAYVIRRWPDAPTRSRAIHGPFAAALLACVAMAVLDVPRSAAAEGPPDALRRIAEQRDWRKARIEMYVTSTIYPDGRYLGAIVSGDDTLTLDRGDEEGVIARDRDGNPGPLGTGPVYSLRLGENAWIYGDGQVHSDLFAHDRVPRSIDARSLGLSALGREVGPTAEALLLAVPSVRFDRAQEGEFEIVRASYAAGSTEWRLDPRQGGLPVSVTNRDADGRILAECRSELAEVDGVWVPARVTYYGVGGDAGGDVRETVEVLQFELDPPDVPDRLTPEYIGIDAGMNVNLHRVLAGTIRPERGLWKWDGQRVRTLEEFNEAYRSGEISLGPMYLSATRRAKALEALYEQRAALAAASPLTAEAHRAATQPVASQPTETLDGQTLLERLTGWEAYTRRFIERHALDDEQTQRARSVLRECQELGEAHLAAIRTELEEWQRAGGQLAPSTQPAGDAGERMIRLHARIFGRLNHVAAAQLIPRLDALPTRAQRRAAGEP